RWWPVSPCAARSRSVSSRRSRDRAPDVHRLRMTNLSLEQALGEVERAAARVAAADASTLADLRTELLGRKAGKLTYILRSLASLSPEERRDLGARANQLKQQVGE